MSDLLDQAEIDALLAEAGGLAAQAATTEPDSSDACVPAPSSAPGPGPPEDVVSPDVQQHLARILEIEVPVSVRLACQAFSVGDIVRWMTGTIVEFTKSADHDLELLVGRKPIGTGHAVKVGEKFGLRITQVAAAADTIQAMGPSRP